MRRPPRTNDPGDGKLAETVEVSVDHLAVIAFAAWLVAVLMAVSQSCAAKPAEDVVTGAAPDAVTLPRLNGVSEAFAVDGAGSADSFRGERRPMLLESSPASELGLEKLLG